MVVCVRVKNSFYSIIYVFTFILKLYCIYHFLCFPSVTYRSDIDECSSGSHDCHQNATCVNTAGHYDCICKPGLTGNGRNCSGEAIIFISFVKRHRGSPSLNLVDPFKKAWWQEQGTLFFPSGGTRLVTLRWKRRRLFSSEKVEGKLTLPQPEPKTLAPLLSRVANCLQPA